MKKIKQSKFLRESANRDKIIVGHVKTNNLTIYGARAVEANIGKLLARRTNDYDIYSSTPRKSARQVERLLDKDAGGNFYFVKEAMHKGTWKVKHKGADMKQNTEDDLETADYSKPERKVKTVVKKGVRYVALSETAKDKRKSLSDKQFEFRHAKDSEDLYRIQEARRIKRWNNRFKK